MTTQEETILSGTPWIVPNIQYVVDYTANTYGTAQTIVDITTPNYPLRINLFAFSVGSTIPTNWLTAIRFDKMPFAYPDGISEFQPPPLVYTLCGNVPTDYIDVPPSTRITILGYMNGTATANSTLALTISAKARLNKQG